MPQERVQRYTVEHLTDLVRVAPMVQILDAPVPQMVDNPTDAFRVMDQPIAEQVIAAPKFVASSCPSREALREPQTAEQSLEVTTILHFLKQKVDLPAPRRGNVFLRTGFVVFVVCGADRSHSSSWSWRLWRSPRFFSQDTVLCSGMRSRSLTFQFLVVWVTNNNKQQQ